MSLIRLYPRPALRRRRSPLGWLSLQNSRRSLACWCLSLSLFGDHDLSRRARAERGWQVACCGTAPHEESGPARLRRRPGPAGARQCDLRPGAATGDIGASRERGRVSNQAVSVDLCCFGEAGAPVAVVSLPARGRPPEAAARRAGLEFVEKLLPTNLTSTDTTERNAGMLRVPLVASLVKLATGPGCSSPWSWRRWAHCGCLPRFRTWISEAGGRPVSSATASDIVSQRPCRMDSNMLV